MSARDASPHRLDPAWHATIGQFTGGLSPAALATAYVDWAMHLIGSPDKQADLMKALLQVPDTTDPSSDARFAHPAWSVFPYSVLAQNFLALQNWWDMATTGLSGVDPKHEQIVNFSARQWLDMWSPTNFAPTNPQVLERTREEMGQNLIRGTRYWIEDFNRLITDRPRRQSVHKVGADLATTPGDVVFRNDLIELIRYRPTTKTIRPEPMLIVPAWIMKYYILDLTEQRSMIAYLRDQGFEVFAISWKNPDDQDADLSMQDYVDLGIRAAVRRIHEMGAPHMHAAGYCLGGTLLSMTAAAMARDGDESFATISLLASQVDFSEPGELSLFINESQVAFLEDMMSSVGYLKADQMAGAFQLLRSNDLIWSRVVRHYLLGEHTADNPLLSWNADATRMPSKMHSEYLRDLFLHNDLSEGQYQLDGAPVVLSDIKCPVYCVATETDHVSPWQSVFRMHTLLDGDLMFVLTNGGHNGGILSEPGHKGRHFRYRLKTQDDPVITAQDWFDGTTPAEGSWWEHWSGWLKGKSGARGAPRLSTVDALDSAPGQYVFG